MFLRRTTGPNDTPAPLDHLSGGQRREVAPHVDRLAVEAGTVLTREHRRAHQFVVLLSGHATAESADGPSRPVDPGTYLGANELILGESWTETVRADEPSEILVVGGPAFRWLVSEVSGLRAEVLCEAG